MNKHLLPYALAEKPSDLVFRNIHYLDVFQGVWVQGDVTIKEDTIVSLDLGMNAETEIDGTGLFLVPGFIDAHVHIESSLVTPQVFEKAVLPKGTTTAICDPHELTNVMGVQALNYFLAESEKLKLNLKVMLSSCVPATHLETNGGGKVLAKDLVPFRDHPHALGLAEVMNVPGILHGDDDLHAKLDLFQGKAIDGHAPLLTGKALSAYAMCGISSCHESSELTEAKEKLKKGMSVWIREGSVAKDLLALIPALTPRSAPSIGFCTDDRNPLDIVSEGHVDYLLRLAIANGADPVDVYRSASYSVAFHYGLDRGLDRIGAIAPGFIADLVLMTDEKAVSIKSVYKSGRDVQTLKFFSDTTARTPFPNTIHIDTFSAEALQGPQGLVHVIDIIPGKIITGRSQKNSDDLGVAKLTVLERHGKNSPPANAYASGFGQKFLGAIASSVGHDSHNLICAGSNVQDMQVALMRLKHLGGGFCVVQNKKVLAELALPFAGLMTDEDPVDIVNNLRALRAASHQIGCELDEPFLQLAFLSLPVIPTLKLTDMGLVDVDEFKLIDVIVGS